MIKDNVFAITARPHSMQVTTILQDLASKMGRSVHGLLQLTDALENDTISYLRDPITGKHLLRVVKTKTGKVEFLKVEGE